VQVVTDLASALAVAGEVPELTVIGGAQIYALALPLADRILLTEVHARPEGDARLTPFDPQVWRETARERWPADERHACDMSFVTLVRRDAV
jgi:dihydrofolate reductase